MPVARLADHGACGACRNPLFDGRPIAVSEAQFERHISRNDIPVVVDFWAPWCGPCRSMAPIFERAASDLEPHVRLLKLNTDDAPSVSSRLGISSIPTLMMFRAGRTVARTAGAMPLQQLLDWIDAARAGGPDAS